MAQNTLSVEEFEKRYGKPAPATLSIDDFKKKYGDPQQAAPPPAPSFVDRFVPPSVREGILGVAEQFIPNLEKPYMAPLDIAKGFQGLIARGLQGNPPKVADVVKGVTQPFREFGSGVVNRDPEKIAHGAGGMLGMAGGLALGTPAGRAGAANAVEAVGQLPGRAGKAAVAKATELATGAPGDPVTAVVKAIKPKASNIGFTNSLDRSLPEIKLSETAMGRPVNGLADLLEATALAKKRVRAQFEAVIGKQQFITKIDGSPIAEAMEKTITRKMKLENPKQAAAIMEQADVYRRTFDLDEIEDLLRTTNAELDAYYGKNPAARTVALNANPDTALLDAQGKALRSTLYGALDRAAGSGKAAQELNRRYGSLINLEKETFRRHNVALRQQPESLTEQMGKVGAMFQYAKGGARMLGGDVVGGAADIASGVAGRQFATIVKERNSADYLIREALKNYPKRPAPLP